jgi:multiple sugar transport system permease protein
MMTNNRVLKTSVECAPAPPFGNTLAQKIDRTFRYWAIIPLLIFLLVFSVYPILQLFRMSVSTAIFQEGRVIWQNSGIENFQTFLADNIFKTALVNTTYFVVVTVSIEMILGFILALMASNLKRNANLYRTILIIPILVPPIAIGTIWRLMYNYDFGILNQFLNLLSLPSQTWVADPKLAMICVMMVDIWHWIPFIFLLMLAGIESLPIEPLEAARVDGASNRQLLRYVILPMLKPTILVTLMFRTIFAFKVFDEVYLLTGGGPGTRTEVISLYINRVYFSQFRWGYGAFLSIVTIALIAIFIIVYNNRIKMRGEI